MNELDPPRIPAGWRARPASQQPVYPDAAELAAVTADLRSRPPLVFAGEVDSLRAQMAAASRGRAFVLMGGDCAETFRENTANHIRLKLQTILQMAAVLTYGASTPVVKIGRMAGQYAKPRSRADETRDGVTLPSYRGDSVNDHAFTPRARTPDSYSHLGCDYQGSLTKGSISTNGVQSESSALADNHQFFDYESTETAMGTKTVKYEGDKAAGASASNADTLAGLPFTCSDKQFSAENKQQYISQEEQVVSAQENAGEKATEAMMALEAVDLFSKEHSGHAPDSMPTTKMLAATGYQQSESPAQTYSMMQSGREGAIEAQQESEQAVAYDLLGVPEYYQCQKQEEAETALF